MLNPPPSRRIYLDLNASTPIAPEVADAMRNVLAEPFGNPSSQHWAGEPAGHVVEKTRAQVAAHRGLRDWTPQSELKNHRCGGKPVKRHVLPALAAVFVFGLSFAAFAAPKEKTNNGEKRAEEHSGTACRCMRS
jgi:hypothetical protein